jgi:hypothetical protein
VDIPLLPTISQHRIASALRVSFISVGAGPVHTSLIGRFRFIVMYGGEGEIRTHATVARPNAFRVRPLITTWVLLQNILKVERVRGIEPPPSAWEAEILPLNHTRIVHQDVYYYSIIKTIMKDKNLFFGCVNGHC